MIPRLLLLLTIAGCAAPAAVPSAAPPTRARDVAEAVKSGFGHRPRLSLIYVVDGVQHTDSSFRALQLGPDDIEAIEVVKCTDYCTEPRVITIRTRRAAASPPSADPTPPNR